MPRPNLALLISGKLGKPDEQDDGEEMDDSKEEAKLDAVRHLISVVRGVKPELVHDKDAQEALDCLHNLWELCRDDEEPDGDEEEPEADHEEGADEASPY